ncbi:ImmA/IrrE family metallo-endopeptidase [Succinivibrio dextrinosolvens]|uniref:ImmA/IrrE family metallo-endopeptidase n=1 Tax=Succinivibrio dextrinosolvens TaxID=83771 RepID=UPI0004E23DDA|nr:ImmA/IrrE family metallo-endopeptidase [Succinivibrio dextrinosolvens]
MAEYFPIRTSVINWACDRIGLAYSDISKKNDLKNLAKETNGIVKLTMKQLESLSHVLRYPLFYLMLDKPVESLDILPINDFRTINGKEAKTSIDLCEQIDFCKAQQDWFIDFVKENSIEPFEYISKFTIKDNPEIAGHKIRNLIKISNITTNKTKEFYKKLKEKIEEQYILVCSSKVLKNTTHRLSISEFRGYALTDKYAPLIFINGNDSINAQIFTLCHELGHICLGVSGISDVSLKNNRIIEKWCNNFAASILMPLDMISLDFKKANNLNDFLESSQDKYHVSINALVIRLYNLNLITKKEFEIQWEKAEKLYVSYLNSLKEQRKGSDAKGDYYKTAASRLSSLLTRSIIASTAVGNTTFREASNLLGFSSVNTFDSFIKKQKVFQ